MFKSPPPDESTDPDAEAALRALVRRTLPDVDADTVAIVAGIAGLLACAAYADRDYSEVEMDRVAELLQTIQGIESFAARSLVTTLKRDAVELSTVHSARFCRTLVELADRELRLETLRMLLEVAAADHQISHDEVKVLRQLTTALGLSQDDYTALQTPHRDKLSLDR